MGKVIGLMAIVAVLAVTGPAGAVTTMSWNFNDNTTQGWTLVQPDTTPPIGAPAVAPNPTGSIAEPSDGTGSLYLPDSAFAYLNLPTNVNSFVFEADISGAAMTTNYTRKAGMAYRHTYNKDTTTANTLAPATAVTAWAEGRDSASEREIFCDSYTGLSTNTNMRFWKNSAGSYNTVETGRLKIYYNWATITDAGVPAGDYTGKIVITFTPVDFTPATTNEKYLVYGAAHVNTTTGQVEPINMLRLGGDTSWSQFNADNVSLTYVPEPATLGLLVLGLPMLRRRRA
jgi:hypothetical protein